MKVRVPSGEEFSVNELHLNRREALLMLRALQELADEDPEYQEIEGEEDQIVIQIGGMDE